MYTEQLYVCVSMKICLFIIDFLNLKLAMQNLFTVIQV